MSGRAFEVQSDRIFRQAVQTVKASDLTAEDGTDDTVGIFDRKRDIDLLFAGDSGFADCQQLAAVQRFFQLVVLFGGADLAGARFYLRFIKQRR